jgi:hypothetical protein
MDSDGVIDWSHIIEFEYVYRRNTIKIKISIFEPICCEIFSMSEKEIIISHIKNYFKSMCRRGLSHGVRYWDK